MIDHQRPQQPQLPQQLLRSLSGHQRPQQLLHPQQLPELPPLNHLLPLLLNHLLLLLLNHLLLRLPTVLHQLLDAEFLKEKKPRRCVERGTSSSSFVKSTKQDAPTSDIPIPNVVNEVEEPSSSGPR